MKKDEKYQDNQISDSEIQQISYNGIKLNDDTIIHLLDRGHKLLTTDEWGNVTELNCVQDFFDYKLKCIRELYKDDEEARN